MDSATAVETINKDFPSTTAKDLYVYASHVTSNTLTPFLTLSLTDVPISLLALNTGVTTTSDVNSTPDTRRTLNDTGVVYQGLLMLRTVHLTNPLLISSPKENITFMMMCKY